MNKQEFEEMQNEYALVIYSYESFLKEGQILDLKYNYYFGDLLDKVNKYSEESRYMQLEMQAFQNNNNSIEEADKLHEGFVKEYADNLKKIEAKHIYAQKIVVRYNSLTDEGNEKLNDLFKEYVLKYHPAVKLYVSKGEVELYNHVKALYFESNYEGLKAILDNNIPHIKFKELEEADVIKFSETYYNSRLQLGREVNERKAKYPYAKGDVFKDELTQAGEEGEIKANLTKIRNAHKEISQKYEMLLGRKFSL